MRGFLIILLAVSAFATTVPTAHNDTSRTGANTTETILTPTSVTAGKFHLLCKMTVDGDVYAQPLYVPGATISGSQHDVVLVATMHNSVYAFEVASCAQLWKTNFGTAWQYPNYPHTPGSPLEYTHEIGASELVVDPAGALVFVITVNNSGIWTLRKLALSTGVESANVTIGGSYSSATFDGARQMQRTALLLSADRGTLYFGFGSQSDLAPYYGWLFAYSSSLLQTGIFATTPAGNGGGVWNGGAGPTLLANGDVVVSTGNGDYDGIGWFSQSIIRFAAVTLAQVDWYTPSDWSTMNNTDLDLGSSASILIAGTTKVVTGAKDKRIFVVDTTCMGHLGGSVGGCGPAQVFSTGSTVPITVHSGIYNVVFWNSLLFAPDTDGHIYRFAYNSGTGLFNTTPVVSAATYAFPGAQMSVSANGTATAIVWATTCDTSASITAVDGTLRALNPTDLSEYWNSNTTVGDTLGTLSKFAAPTIADGHVIVAAQSGFVNVYGLKSVTQMGGSSKTGGSMKISK